MTEDVATVCPGSSVVSAAKTMSSKNISCIIVSDNGHLSGVITETDLLKRAVADGNDFRKMKVEQTMSSPVLSVPRNLSVLEAGKIMEAKNIRRLVVLQEGRLAGIITQTDIVRVLTSYGMWKDVSEIMTSDVAVIASSASAREAADLMASRDTSCLVAMDNDTVVGIFTERDLLKRIVALKRNPAQTSLKKVMSSPVVSIPANYSIPSAGRVMEKMKIRRLVVIDNGILRGVITQTNMLKAIENNLQEEEENYFRLMGESLKCIYAVDLDGNTTYVNPAFVKLLEVTDPDELINKPFLPERFWDNPRQRNRLLGRLKRANVEVKELTLRTANGKRLFVTLFSNRIKNIKGEITGSQGVLYNVTAKKKLATLREMEQQLRSSEDLLKATLESTADGILVVDEKGQVNHMNKRFAKIWDIPEELVQQRDGERLFKHVGSRIEDPPEFLTKLRTACPTHEASFDILYLKEGKVMETYSLSLIREGRVAGRVWSFRDVTKRRRAKEALRKAHDELEVRVEQRTAELTRTNEVLESQIAEREKAEQTLRESEEKYKTLTESSLTGIFIQQDGRYVFVNKRFARIHGYRPEELLGRQYQSLIHPDERKTMAQLLSKRPAGEPFTQRYEMRRLKKNGQTIWCEVMITGVDYKGKPAIIGNIIDTTERKRAEELLEKLNEDLESAVRELNRSNKELQDFAYVTAHDLKSPLRAIGALAHWISTDYADKFDEDGREQMKLLTDRVKRMHNLIEAILHYSRVGREKEKHGQVNLNELVPAVIDMVAPPRNIAITTENQLPVIECEETHIIQVFQNLLSNAVKYLDKPQGRIRIGCVEEDGFWKFSVADNGPGIKEKYFEKIFQIFQTLSAHDDFESTGVGLTIIKKIVELYDGKIWVESKPGEGSIFFFTLPKQKMAVEHAKLKANSAC